jgi:O-antigen ligase
VGREERFFNGLLLACEIATFGTAICYFGLGENIWGNPNALGAAMSIGVYPVLLWGWLTTEGKVARNRRLTALLLCAYLIFFSLARAGMISMIVVTLALCLCLRQYKLLTKAVGLTLLLVAVTGMVSPMTLRTTFSSLRDAVFYKGHKEVGVFGSRMTPWQATITQIKAHPWFGTGYGTSPNGQDPGLEFGKFASTSETVGEHGSSYMTIVEWVGLLGIVPFIALLGVSLQNVWRVCSWMRRTGNPRHYAIPLAMVLLAGILHASFEDWLFAIGAYPSVYFWTFAFLLADLAPAAAVAQAAPLVVRPFQARRAYSAAVSNR